MPRKPDTIKNLTEDISDLRADLEQCRARLDALERERETTIRRIGSLQAELDHLRAKNRTP
jgi:predicted nuclease with TOPRIM domain